MGKLLIKGATVITMENHDSVFDGGEIAVEGQNIVSAGPAGSAPEGFDPDRTIDASGMVALPGFVNTHTHAAMTLLRSYADDLPLMKWLEEKIWPLEARLEAEDIYWGTMLCCLEMIRSGTTSFADMYFFMDQVALAVEKAGMRASLSRGMIGVGPEAQQALDYGPEFVGRWHGQAGGRITVRLGPHAPYTCPPDYLKKVIEMAGKLGVGIHIHLAETRTEVEDMLKNYGKTPIQLVESLGLFELPVLAAHCVHLDERDMEILAAKKAIVAHNPESNMKLASGIAPVTALLKAGVAVGLGTDGAASNNNLDMMEEMRSAALLQKVSTMDPLALPSFQALGMATAGGAGAMGLEGQLGLLKKGCKADLILLDAKKPHFFPRNDWMAHIVYAAQSSDVDTVIIDGNVVMEGRKVLTIDEDEVYQQVQSRAERLTK
ncbi:MAG: N-ethylammeline chlorohydrolase [Peptococcaceae bacterium BICA1-7]|nr:MAG: N-ethylammeline chlorohydrolase [Peptococcaceae bacterium BICA1-7]HBV96480.1 amidohydrolase [Desulfotomaculum sp.]